jgi:hypothetical protein
MIKSLNQQLLSAQNESNLYVRLEKLNKIRLELINVVVNSDFSLDMKKEAQILINLTADLIEKTTTSFSEIKEAFFRVHSAQDIQQDLEKMFHHYICSDEAENSTDRQSATVTYLQLKKLLGNF